MNNSMNNMIAYYAESEVKVINEYHPHFCATGRVIGGENTIYGFGLKIKRFDTQEQFYVYDTNHLKIIKRK
ncbi:hypothetical protein [Pedobacter sp. NJ-S-72]